jgi:hypothetical protein
VNTERIRWRLRFGDTLIAEIADADCTDWPWTYGRLVDSSTFDRFRKYFTDWDLSDDEDPEIDELIDEIQSMGPITLIDEETNRTYDNPTINQNGNSIWFRLHLTD